MAIIRKWSGDGLSAGSFTSNSTAGTGDDVLAHYGSAASDVTVVSSGPRPPRIQVSGLTSANGVTWDLGSSYTNYAVRAYFEYAGPRSTSSSGVIMNGIATNGTSQWRIDLSTVGAIRFRGLNNASVWSPSTTLALNTLYRIELVATGTSMTAYFYDGDTMTEVDSNTFTIGSGMQTIRFGDSISDTHDYKTYDDLAVSDTNALIGPASTSVTGSVDAVTATASTLAPVPVVAGLRTATTVTPRAIVSTVAPVPVVVGAAAVTAPRAQSSAASTPPTVSSQIASTVAAAAATATVLAPAPTVAGLAQATTIAPVALATTMARPATLATGVGVTIPTVSIATAAPAPTVLGSGGVTAIRATATAFAPVPVVSGAATLTAAAATATAMAHIPGVASVAAVASPRAIATTLAPTPVVTASSVTAAPRAVASALATPPTVAGGVGTTSPRGVVTATAVPPSVSVISVGVVAAPAATVSAAARIPSIPRTVLAVRATVAVFGRVPGITVVVPDNFVRTLPRTVTTSLTLSGSPGKVASLNLTKTLNHSSNAEPKISGVGLTLNVRRELRLLSTGFNVPGTMVLTRTRTLTIAASAISIVQALVRTRTCSLAMTGLMNITSPLALTSTVDLGLSGTALIPGALVYRRCETHTAYLYDRGGRRQIAALSPLALVRWERRRDDISTAEVIIKSADPACAGVLELIEGGRMELVIFRGNLRVWEGPITRVSYQGDQVNIFASDVMYYVHRTIMTQEYDNRYPNNGPVIDRVKRIMVAELARWEAQDPPANVINHVQYIRAVPPAVEAGTAARTLPYEMTVFEHVDTYAARGGLDYTVVGRSILFFDVHHAIGQTAMVTRDDFIGDPIITQYAAELATYVAMTDGKGNFGAAGGDDPYYGRWEVLHQAYDENAGPVESNQPPSVAEMTSQAKRAYAAAKYPPLVVRVPDNTRLNPAGALDISTLVPGVHVPLNATLPGRSVTQMQKLDNMSVEETPENGETIQVTLSPATLEKFVEE